MTTTKQDAAAGAAPPSFDRRDFGTALRGHVASLQVVIGLALLWTVFALANDRFLSAANLTNLALQVTSVGVISVGVVLVLLLGEIDLSIGSVSGLCAAIMVILNVSHGVPAVLAIALALVAAVVIGLLQGFIVTKFGVPSFVVTLGGLIGWQGVQLYVLGDTGAVNVSDPVITNLTSTFFPAWVGWLVLFAVVVLSLTGLLRRRSKRQAAGLEVGSLIWDVVRVALAAVTLLIAVIVLGADRGIPLSLIIFLGVVAGMDFVARRSLFGRHIYAIGGSDRAAGRVGIPVARIRICVFVLSSVFAAAGGILAASRLFSVNQSSGGGDVLLNAIAGAVIGGTSLFGGRGTVWAALTGALVIGSISNGMDLLAFESSVKLMITGAVLVLAVVLDSVTAKRKEQ